MARQGELLRCHLVVFGRLALSSRRHDDRLRLLCRALPFGLDVRAHSSLVERARAARELPCGPHSCQRTCAATAGWEAPLGRSDPRSPFQSTPPRRTGATYLNTDAVGSVVGSAIASTGAPRWKKPRPPRLPNVLGSKWSVGAWERGRAVLRVSSGGYAALTRLTGTTLSRTSSMTFPSSWTTC